LFTAGQLVREPVAVVVEPDEIKYLFDSPDPIGAAYPVSDVLRDGDVWKKCVLLEHHSDVSVLWGDHSGVPGNDLTSDGDRARHRLFEASDCPEGCCLPASGRSDERHE